MLTLLTMVAAALPQAIPGTITDEGPAMDFAVEVLAVDTNEGCDVGDVDNDGDLDVVAGRLWFAAPEFTPRPLRALGEFGADYSASSGEFLHDVDGDGWLDVLSIPFLEPELCWYRNPGAAALAKGKLGRAPSWSTRRSAPTRWRGCVTWTATARRTSSPTAGSPDGRCASGGCRATRRAAWVQRA